MDAPGPMSAVPGTSEEQCPPPPPPAPPSAEPKRSNVCAVCGAVSEHFYLNYGAAACFSCRAFFRRANLNLKVDREVTNPRAMVCKNGGRCEVTVANRKCRRCRYDRCLRAGMNPSAVLDDDGKKVRFRKMLKKKMQLPEEVWTSELTKAGRAKPWTKSKLTLAESELEPPKKRGRKPKVRPSGDVSQPAPPAPPSSLSYPTSLEEREQPVRDLPPLVALGPPRGLERAVRLQIEQQNGAYADVAAETAVASEISPNGASASAAYESRFHNHFMNGHFMDYSRFGATSYGQVEQSQSLTGYSNHGCHSSQPGQPTNSRFNCGNSSNDFGRASNFNDSHWGSIKSEADLDVQHIATSVPSANQRKPDDSFLTPRIKTEVETTDERAIDESNSSGDPFLVKSDELEELREDDLAELNQNSEVAFLSRNGRISIHFRSSTKPELFFRIQEEINGEAKDDCVLMSPRTLRRGSVRKEMMTKLHNYQKAWELALRSMVITEPLLEGLLGLHRGTNAVTKEMLKVHFVALAKLFTDFASLHPEFTRLTKLDQRKCLTRNVGIFIQYVLCRYFGSVKNGAKDQINWMLVSKLQTTVGNENLDPINLENFNLSLKILESEKVPEYQSTIDEAARLAEKFETRNNCTLALCFLYDVPIATHLNDPEAVDDLRCDIHTLVDWAAEVYGSPGKDDIVALTSALGKMKDVFDANTSWDTADTVHSISLWQQITLPYCAEEESWALQRFSLFQKAFHEVELGGEILNDFIYFSHDVPISKQFMPRAMAVFAERFRNILRRMDEFSLLTPGQKKRALETCVFHSVAIFVAKLESCDNGYQQLTFAMGSEGEDVAYTRDILSLTDTRKLKKLCMENVNPTTGNLEPEDLQRFAFCIGKVIPLVRDLEVLKLMVFVLLFNESAEDGDQICVAIQQRYLTLLRRRLAHLRKSNESQDELGEDLRERDDGSFEMFRSGMAHIKELSVIMHRLAMQKRDEGPQQRPAIQ